MRKAWLLLAVLSAALILWLFAPALTGNSSFAFRDAAHFYHPLFQYIRGEWGSGRLPLWNPYENLGVPLVAENTSSVFYPGKLLFALPLDYTWLYNLYIVAHVALAAVTSYRLARHLRAGTLGAVLGALSYAFSGSVLFQYCNVIFLVGAAWLPLALLYADRMLRLGEAWATVGFGVVVALIVLGGDPHLAYNIGLAAAGYAGLIWWDERRRHPRAPTVTAATDSGVHGWRLPSWAPRRLIWLGLASLIAALVAAIQVAPSLEASPYGERAQYDAPRNIYEYAQAHWNSDEPVSHDGLLGASLRGHHSHVYAFSLAPWRVLEMLWPNVSGKLFPTYRRWLLALQAEDTVWLPSLYFGLLPLLLAVRRFSLRRTAPIYVRGLSWLALVALVASFGSYGLGYLVKLLLGTGDDLDIGDELGGVYWLIVTFAPGYVQFRYPAKLTVLVALALSMLAACGWRGAWCRRAYIRYWLLAVPVLSAAATAAALLSWPWFSESTLQHDQAEFLGLFDWDGAWSNFFDAMLHASLLGTVLGAVFSLARKAPRYRRLMQFATLMVLALDLAIAQQGLFDFAPAGLWRDTPRFVREHPDFADRVYRTPGLLLPHDATTRDSPYVRSIRHDRESLSPKYPLPWHVRVMPVAQSVAGADFDLLLDTAREYSDRMRRHRLPDGSVLDLLNVEFCIASDSSAGLLTNPEQLSQGVLLGQRATAIPRAWIVHRVETRPGLESRSERAARRDARELLFPDNKPRDWRQIAVVESAEAVQLSAASDVETPAGESCSLVRDEPLLVELRATLTAPGLVVLADQYFPGWELSVETGGVWKELPILRTNRVMRGVVLPPGDHRLVYRYRPKSFYAGAVVSALAILGLAIASVVRWRRARPGKGASQAAA